MDALPLPAAAAVAAHLLDERDLAPLQCTSRFWLGVFADATLWATLLERRFGAGTAAVPGAGEAAAGGEADAALRLRQRFVELAWLERPAPQLDRIIHLDGTHLQVGERGAGRQVACADVCRTHALMLAARMHGFAHSCACSCSKLPASLPCILQVVTEAGTRTAGPRNALKVHSVSWLELACRFAGVLPGRYRACWRMRLSGHYVFTGGRLVVRHLPATGPAAVAALAAGGQDPLLPVLQEDGVRGQLRANAAPEPHEARSQLTLVTRAHLDEEFRQV